jgi:hypothetical protein
MPLIAFGLTLIVFRIILYINESSMLMRLLSLFFLLISITTSLNAQGQNLRLIDSLTFQGDRFWGVDIYDRFYFSEKNVFYKTENKQKFQFQDLQLGDLESVDLLNPLKILLFYKEANTIVILDNRLNEINRINFGVISDFKTVDFVGVSKDNLLWIFNADIQQLELFDYQKELTQNTSLPINQEILHFKSNYNFCWFQHSDSFTKYNITGSVVDRFSLKGVISFATFKNQVMVQTESSLNLFEKDSHQRTPFKKPKITFNQFYFNAQNLYICSSKVIYTYKLIAVNN